MSGKGPWIQTMDGEAFRLLAPEPGKIHLTTTAIALSRLCRFGGHTKRFYSVADHSIRVCHFVLVRNNRPDLCLAALLHDAAEAYSGFGDVLRPAKLVSPVAANVIDSIHSGVDAAIAEKFRFDPVLFRHELVRLGDDTLLATEQRDLMAEPPESWPDLPEPLEAIITPRSMEGAAWMFECVGRQLLFAMKMEGRGHETQSQ